MNRSLFRKEVVMGFKGKEFDNLTQYLAEVGPDPEVSIFLSDDTGEDLYVVAFSDWDEFWLDSFETREEAEEWCKRYSLKVEDLGIIEL